MERCGSEEAAFCVALWGKRKATTLTQTSAAAFTCAPCCVVPTPENRAPTTRLMAMVRPLRARTKAGLRAFCTRARQRRTRNCSHCPTPWARFGVKEEEGATMVWSERLPSIPKDWWAETAAYSTGGMGRAAGPKAARRETMPRSSESAFRM
eukprot:scaffold300832_cov32-Tisochrysis_lutea.AAC.3